MKEDVKQAGLLLEQALTDEEADKAIQTISKLPLKDIKELAQHWDVYPIKKAKLDYLLAFKQYIYTSRKTKATITGQSIQPAVSTLT